MNESSKIFLNKKILIYGLGKTGISVFRFLKKKSDLILFDDNPKLKTNSLIKKKIKSIDKIQNFKFDLIIISPGIDINNCKLSKLLKKNLKSIYTDLDVFYSFFSNDCITVTGTNGKSTTCKLLYKVLKDQKYDVKLAGNIGIPILSIKKILPKTIFVIEASSYQLDYSKIFNSKYGAILNISPDHIERHRNFKDYISAKFKLLKNQKRGSVGFLNKNDNIIQKKLKKNIYKSKIIYITKLKKKFINSITNDYFLSNSNQENLSFVIGIIKKFKIKKKILIKTINKFSGLKYRQQVIYDQKNLKIINDSKSTSYSSSVEMLKTQKRIYWLLGGIPKKGDKLTLPKKYYDNITAYVYGKNQYRFARDLKNKIKFYKYETLKKATSIIFKKIKRDKIIKNTILFSPASASFDSFKNFEERGFYFNKLIKEYKNVR